MEPRESSLRLLLAELPSVALSGLQEERIPSPPRRQPSRWRFAQRPPRAAPVLAHPDGRCADPRHALSMPSSSNVTLTSPRGDAGPLTTRASHSGCSTWECAPRVERLGDLRRERAETARTSASNG